jgi:hypothetical protein
MNRITLLAVMISTILLLYVLEMVRRRKLREEDSILWLVGCLVMLILSLKKGWLEWLSRAVGIVYPPSLLFLVGIFFILLILIHFSITISKLHQMNKKMIQDIALMKQREEERQEGTGSSPP